MHAPSPPPSRPPLPTEEEIRALPRDGGEKYNRLVFERSPYLLQHAANPVDWWPWSEEAFERARAEDKPVFLSVGYSTCHWCHVMEHESFEHEEVAAALNEHMIPIKVDREERPDIDQVYMTVTQALTGQGGWPMTVVMTPDKRPFFAGTYFPKDGLPHRPGMLDLVPALAQAWKEQRDRVETSANEIVSAISRLGTGTPGSLPAMEALRGALADLASSYDDRFGGFGEGRNKFPVPHNLSLLLRLHQRFGDDNALAMVEHTLVQMRRGGLFDHVGFGFHRYSTDRVWLLPHFEKMLYDQAMLLIAYSEAHLATGKEEHARTAREIATYVLRDLTAPEGGFYSAEDADSEGVEGKFYVWTPDEVREVLGEQDGAFWCETFHIEAEGNFYEEATGTKTGESIPHRKESDEELAQRLGVDPGELTARLERCREALFAHREKRVHPFKDDKVLTDWNGLAIAAFSIASRALDEPEYASAAARAAEFVLTALRTDDGRLLKRARGTQAGLPAHLDDYAFMAWGLLELYETTFDPRWLREALALVETMRAHFADSERGGYFLAADDGEALIVRAKDAYDGAIPSGNGVAACVLVRLARLTGDRTLEDDARRTMEAFGETLAKAPTAHAQMLHALDHLLGPSVEVVVAGEPGAADFEALRKTVHGRFLPRASVLQRSGAPDDPITEIAPFTREQGPVNGAAAAWVCRNYACERPVTTPEALAKALDR